MTRDEDVVAVSNYVVSVRVAVLAPKQLVAPELGHVDSNGPQPARADREEQSLDRFLPTPQVRDSRLDEVVPRQLQA